MGLHVGRRSPECLAAAAYLARLCARPSRSAKSICPTGLVLGSPRRSRGPIGVPAGRPRHRLPRLPAARSAIAHAVERSTSAPRTAGQTARQAVSRAARGRQQFHAGTQPEHAPENPAGPNMALRARRARAREAIPMSSAATTSGLGRGSLRRSAARLLSTAAPRSNAAPSPVGTAQLQRDLSPRRPHAAWGRADVQRQMHRHETCNA